MEIEEEIGKLFIEAKRESRLGGKEKGLMIAVAESCTGGLIQKLITDVPGSSEYFLGGVVAYSNLLKQKLLNVSAQTLISYGAVSYEVACEMASGIREITGADIGVATTGIAGPTGEAPDKPVGLVYIGLCTEKILTAHKFLFKGARQKIREQTAYQALKLIKEMI
ncbi:MAG: CinA family protein [Candidatus Stahlbacteria bacterium]|nr:CinA family protein [Candidatus Stahlbacteria bacterium]